MNCCIYSHITDKITSTFRQYLSPTDLGVVLHGVTGKGAQKLQKMRDGLWPQLFCRSALLGEFHFSAALTLFFYHRAKQERPYIILTHCCNYSGSAEQQQIYKRKQRTAFHIPKGDFLLIRWVRLNFPVLKLLREIQPPQKQVHTIKKCIPVHRTNPFLYINVLLCQDFSPSWFTRCPFPQWSAIF